MPVHTVRKRGFLLASTWAALLLNPSG